MAQLRYDDLTYSQLSAIEYIHSGEDSLICADVGTGKTVIALTAADDAQVNGEVHRWLIVAPLLVAQDTWLNEPAQWQHLAHIQLGDATGDAAHRHAAINSPAHMVVINYENLQWLLDEYPRKGKRDELPFDGVIFDEIDKLKDCSSKRFKELRNRIGKFRKRVGLTGTLVPNDLTEVWGQTYMIDAGQTFGRSFYKWRREYFYPLDFNQRKWAPLPGTREKMIDELAAISYRIKARDLAEVRIGEPHEMELPPEIRAVYRKLERDYFIILEDADKKQRKVDAANAAVLAGKLQQICAGFSYVDRSSEAVWHSFARFDWIEQQIRIADATGQQLLIFYHFNEERAELQRRYPSMRFIAGGVSTRRKRETIELWNAGRLPFMALHPASAAHGLNLQRSGAHHIAFLTMPWSGGLFKQAVGRLARRGQPEPVVYVWCALFNNTIDGQVFDTVTGRIDGMEAFLDDLEAAAT